MKRTLCLLATTLAALTLGAFNHTPTQAAPTPTHDITHPGTTPRTIPVEHANTGTVNTEHALNPEYATNCTGTIRSTRTSAVGNCYNYSGSGSLKYQIAALGIDACGRRMWFYGSVGWVYYPGKTTSGKTSYVYSPGLTWRFYAWQIIVWKP